MTQALLRLEGTLWWVKVDVEQEKILGQYYRPSVEADIAAIQATLLQYPSLSVLQEDLEALIWLVNNYEAATAERKARVIAMLNEMWTAYEQEPKLFEAAQLRARLVEMQTLLAKMVV